MDKDWAEHEAVRLLTNLKYYSTNPSYMQAEWDLGLVSKAFIRVRREAIESCAVIAEQYPWMTNSHDVQRQYDIAKCIRESEGKV